MKKVLLTIILGLLLAGLMAPLANTALAIGGENLNECCKINAKFNVFSVKIGNVDLPLRFNHKTSCIVGAKGASCVIDNTDRSNNFTDYTDFDADTIGCGENAQNTGYRVMENWGLVCLLNAVYTVTNWIFYLIMIAIVVLFVIAAAMFMLAGGDMGKTKKAKGLMILGIVGIVIALIAKLVPSMVKLIVAM